MKMRNKVRAVVAALAITAGGMTAAAPAQADRPLEYWACVEEAKLINVSGEMWSWTKVSCTSAYGTPKLVITTNQTSGTRIRAQSRVTIPATATKRWTKEVGMVKVQGCPYGSTIKTISSIQVINSTGGLKLWGTDNVGYTCGG